jgi:hypothetical protein
VIVAAIANAIAVRVVFLAVSGTLTAFLKDRAG